MENRLAQKIIPQNFVRLCFTYLHNFIHVPHLWTFSIICNKLPVSGKAMKTSIFERHFFFTILKFLHSKIKYTFGFSTLTIFAKSSTLSLIWNHSFRGYANIYILQIFWYVTGEWFLSTAASWDSMGRGIT